jgi:hypothetical protein
VTKVAKNKMMQPYWRTSNLCDGKASSRLAWGWLIEDVHEIIETERNSWRNSTTIHDWRQEDARQHKKPKRNEYKENRPTKHHWIR